MLATLKGKQLYVWFNQRTVSLQIICIYVKYSVQLLCFHRRRTNAKNESERNNIEIFGKKTITKHSSGKCNRDESSAACSTVENLTTFFCVSLFSCQNAWIFTSMTLVVEYQFWVYKSKGQLI